MGQLSDLFEYGSILPFKKNRKTGDVSFSADAGLLGSFLNAAKMPGEAYGGLRQIFDPQTGHVSQDTLRGAFDLAGAVTLGAGALPAQNNSLRMGIKAYHGSPHDFDKFSMDKIGTGEGAQAYGHGLYFAENEGVARSYKDALKLNKGVIEKRLIDKGVSPDIADIVANNFHARKGGGGFGGSFDDIFGFIDEKGPADAIENYRAALRPRKGEIKDAWDSINTKELGSMYEVDINANPDDFLDWDAPMSAQPKGVQDFAKEIDTSKLLSRPRGMFRKWKEGTANEMEMPNGGDLRDAYTDFGSNPALNEKFQRTLQSRGIPGIKYKDRGSRGLDGEGGSRNYVVFDENIISIIKKYGIAGAVAMGAISQEQGEAMAAQQQPNELGDILANALKGRM